ncbi:putative transcription initiation factor IIb-like protein [Cotonvirus japonicus]|uniref:Transcription initiation factor IIb-like protein n=1 Tax=Cotonvirus japonicus TaxID=2811091 RepID=A0ABM7NS66_9VIRU|nr:putative transcription initiation factor IIb-like protein [Cotonvirus japonicus]BCS83002.1 putative transcription initiation factor IIb-like protein [Cotonvirus japonicus]
MSRTQRIISDNLNNLKFLETGNFHRIIEIPKMDINYFMHQLKILETGKNLQSDFLLINSFPNALLLGTTNNTSKSSINIETKKPETKIKKSENIWSILENMDKDNNSESIDNIDSDSEQDPESKKKNKLCTGCGSRGTLIEDQLSCVIVCSSCGMVNDEILDRGPEWRQYYNDDSRGEGVNRCGCPSNFFFPISSQGTILAGTNSSRLKRKQKWNSMIYKERSLNVVFEKISIICSKNNIPKIIVDTAKILYKRLSDCKHKSGNNTGKQIIIRGHNRLSIIAACVYKACEMNKNPRSVKEIASFFELDEKKVTKGNKQFEKIMKNADDNLIVIDQINPNSAEDYIRRHCPKLKINKCNMDIAVRIANNCCRMKLASDHNPQSVAAGSILVTILYCNLNIDKKEISKLFGISDVTIDKIYKKIAPYVEALADDKATDYLISKLKING